MVRSDDAATTTQRSLRTLNLDTEFRYQRIGPLSKTVDAVVIGLGAMGCQTLFSLAERDVNVLGIDQFNPPHPQGSSHGESRLIRLAYFEHPDYVPLLRQSLKRWLELEELSGAKLFENCGVLTGGADSSPLIRGLEQSIQANQLDLESVSADDLQRRFPGFQWPSHWKSYFEPETGFLHAERSIAATLNLAKDRGAEIWADTQVRDVQCSGNSIAISTDQGFVTAGNVVLCLGPWAPLWRQHIDLQLTTLRKTLLWYPPSSASQRLERGMPGFLCDTGEAIFYGMPAYESHGVKVARHDGGSRMDPGMAPPDCSGEIEVTDDFARSYFSPGLRNRARVEYCRYTMSPDGHFCFGTSIQLPQLFYLAGLSGHGFKFSCRLGQLLADWLIDGQIPCEAEFLRSARFGRT